MDSHRYILTVTLNPALDRMLVYRQRGTIGYIEKQMTSAGGKGINVSRALSRFGAATLSTGITGGQAMVEISRLLKQENIPNQFYSALGEIRNTVTLFLQGRKDRPRLFQRSPSISREDYQKFKELYKKLLLKANMVVLSGSSLPGLPKGVYAELIRTARRMNVPVFLDASQDALKEGLMAQPDFIKPNRREIEELLGIKIKTLNDANKAMRRLKAFRLKNIFITLGAQGAIGCNNDDLWYAKAPTIKALNPVGCGDAFVGAVCTGILQGSGFSECLRLGVAAGAVNAAGLVPGRIDSAQVRMLTSRVTLKRLWI